MERFHPEGKGRLSGCILGYLKSFEVSNVAGQGVSGPKTHDKDSIVNY